MRPGTISLCLLVLPLMTGWAVAQTSGSPLPHNTIDCHDWTHNPDGSWTAHDNAKPFDLDKTTNATMRNETIGPHDISMGGNDLWTVLNQKCAAKR